MDNIESYYEMKVKDIERPILLQIVSELVQQLIQDANAHVDDEAISQRVTDLLKTNYKFLICLQIYKVFNDISAGYIKIYNISVINIMQVFYQYKVNEIELNKEMLKTNSSDNIDFNNITSKNGLPYGKAMVLKLDKVLRGELKKQNWDDPQNKVRKVAEEIESKKKTSKK